MASTLIYTNLVEYLADHLLKNLQQMFFLTSYHDFNGVFFIKNKENAKMKSPKMLGQLRETLSCYEFPDSSSFLTLLKGFSEIRNAIFHRLLMVSKEKLDQGVIDKQFSDLRDLAEEILDKYNTITNGIATIWYSIAKPQLKRESSTIEDLQSQISALLSQIAGLQAQLAELTKSEKDKKKKENQ